MYKRIIGGNMEKEKTTKAKMTPVKKDEARQKVEALKQMKKESKVKKDSPAVLGKIDEKEITPLQTDITWNGVTKDFFKNIGIFFKNIGIMFKNLDSSIQICIIIPLAILLIVIGNKFYSESQTTKLHCTYHNTTTSMKIDQNIVLTFKKDRIYKSTAKTSYTIIDSKTKTLGQLETEKRDSNELLNEISGVKASYKIKDDILTNTIEYNFYKLSNDDINELGLDQTSSLTTYKERYEGFGYTCESDK